MGSTSACFISRGLSIIPQPPREIANKFIDIILKNLFIIIYDIF
ncbi:hypothetical protein YPPY13_1209 [Yersinia pestis PY-13]|uniref:Uncharacterized protein n=1 Tax=Yersinia pestis biovar Orientalis str. IP275 TaxID=373665 RepID=A0AAV3B8Q6_YERPE|nr:hypothetical protein YpAngola_A0180 [Yersinia pestis Angola]EDR31409.1 hypothetical protein YPIP275_1344 [Yersinia pestis biovar Orientalis str. IP275]EDR38243.1 hypothetical protein YpF1991016_2989 [Yersinia pestis biovar Orientalis str. F1991016]EDR44633.1 hypothetical protein YpE1979001_2773 [Yersinia pestis biovar Antiqua str. E1979001]EDR50586.1 hypothetical protein YpB42003004_2971 [Yersinia pestis biovar Antiqua str. B42003004]EDR58553.1 hypothetical protein YpMG051020_0975 [Yersinia